MIDKQFCVCRWTPVAHMLTPRMNLGVGAIRDMRDAVTGVTFNAIYAIGGYSGKAILGTAEKYDIQNDMWSDISPMKTPRRNVGEWNEGSGLEKMKFYTCCFGKAVKFWGVSWL